MNTVDLFEAWSRWADADPTLRDARLWGMRILWWARIGKIVVLVGGFVILLDIIGPERLRAALKKRQDARANGRAVRTPFHSWRTMLSLTLAALVVVIMQPLGWPEWALAVVYIVSGGFFGGALGYGQRLIVLFTHEQVFRIARIVSLVLVVAGFHFDMLAS